MSDIKIMVWFFPLLFIFHDLEEIIFIQWWIKKNKCYLCERFPRLSKKLLAHFDNITTFSFAAGVTEEFILICLISVVSYKTNWYLLWTGSFIAFTLHLVIHIFQALIVRKYVPAVATSIICLPGCFYIIMNIVNLFQINTVVMYSILAFVIMAANLVILHKGMDKLSSWFATYEQSK